MKREALPSMTAMSRDSIDRWTREIVNKYPDIVYSDLVIAFCSEFGYMSKRDAENLRFVWLERFEFCDFGGISDELY